MQLYVSCGTLMRVRTRRHLIWEMFMFHISLLIWINWNMLLSKSQILIPLTNLINIVFSYNGKIKEGSRARGSSLSKHLVIVVVGPHSLKNKKRFPQDTLHFLSDFPHHTPTCLLHFKFQILNTIQTNGHIKYINKIILQLTN